MRRIMKRQAKKAGLPPGSLVHTGDAPRYVTGVRLLRYGPDSCEDRKVSDLRELDEPSPPGEVRWLSVSGVHDPAILEEIGRRFGLHPLVLEDVMNVVERPKLEDFGEHVFIVLKLLSYDDDNDEVLTHQVSLVLLRDAVISFHEREEPVLRSVRERIDCGSGRFREMGADYLAYTLIDTIVDQYFVVLEQIEDDTERLEDQVVQQTTPDVLQRIHKLKNSMISLRKSVWPLREVIGSLERGETPLVQERTQVYLRDVYDHTIQIIDTIETFRDILAGMIDIYLSSVSNRLNEVMKVLTIIATIFMPLSFLAGVYGMNFRHFPEIEWRYGYAAFWAASVIAAAVMLWQFRRRKWL